MYIYICIYRTIVFMGEFSSESSALLGVCPLPRASSFVGQGAGCGDDSRGF